MGGLAVKLFGCHVSDGKEETQGLLSEIVYSFMSHSTKKQKIEDQLFKRKSL